VGPASIAISNARTSRGVSTTGSRREAFAETISSGHGSCIASTCLYRNSRADLAWPCVDDDTPALDGEVRQKGLDLGCAQLARMAQAVEVDETPHPAHVGLFRAQ
jgi:hypothetical protein